MIIYEKGDEVIIKDPYQLFRTVEFDIETANFYEGIITLTITFDKEMPESDIRLRVWDAQRFSADTILKNVIEVIGKELSILPEVEEEIVEEISENTIVEQVITEKEMIVPQWIKNSVEMWSKDKMNDDSFIQGIQFLIQEQIIDVPYETNVSEVKDMNIKIFEEEKITNVPDWIKNTSGWWVEGQLSDIEFVNGIKYLIEKGIIIV